MRIVKKKLTLVLASLSIMAMTSITLGSISAFADEVAPVSTSTTVDKVAFTMAKGASVRLAQDGNYGIRYAIEMSKTDYEALMLNVGEGEDKAYSEVSFGVLIAPKSYDTAKPLREHTFDGDLVYDWAEKDETGKWVYNGTKTRIANFSTTGLTQSTEPKKTDVMTYYGSLTNILSANMTLDFVGVGYMKYTTNGDTPTTDYIFTADNENTRSIAYVASATLNANDPQYSSYESTLKNYVEKGIDGETLAFNEDTTSLTALSAENQTQDLSLNTTTNLNVKWTSSDTDVATVENGTLTWKKEGDVTVTANIGAAFTCSKELSSYDANSGNLTQWNRAFGADGVTASNVPTHNSLAMSKEHTLPWDEYAIKYTRNLWEGSYSGIGSVNLNQAYEKDISGYDKISFSVYAEVDESKGFTPKLYMYNGNATTRLPLSSNDWTHIVFYRSSSTLWCIEGAEYGIYITETDISNLNIYFAYGEEPRTSSGSNPASTFYVSTLRASKNATVTMPTAIFTDTAVDVPTVSYDGSTEGVTTELYIDGSTTANNDSTMTFDTEGTHTLLFKVMKDGKFVTYFEKTIEVNEKGNLTGWNKQIDTSGFTYNSKGGTATLASVAATDLSAEVSASAPGDAYYLCYTHANANESIWVGTFVEKDISQYSKFSFWVYTTEKTTVLFANNQLNTESWGISVAANTWTKITFMRKTNTTADGNGRKEWLMVRNGSEDTGGAIRIKETNMDNELRIKFTYAGTHYISTLRAE